MCIRDRPKALTTHYSKMAAGPAGTPFQKVNPARVHTGAYGKGCPHTGLLGVNKRGIVLLSEDKKIEGNTKATASSLAASAEVEPAPAAFPFASASSLPCRHSKHRVAQDGPTG